MNEHGRSGDATGNGPVYRKALLSIGFLSVVLAAVSAYRNPATGYEVSIYAMTPVSVWIGLAVAIAIALSTAVSPLAPAHRGVRWAALCLGGLAMTVFAGLPIVRGYHFFGHQDALTHLGWARAIGDGSISPFDLLYPGIHTLSVVVSSAIGVPISRALLLVVLLSTVAFLVFVPLSVAVIAPDSLAVSIATFGAFLLLPVTTIATFMQPHAMTQTILLFALFVYVLLKYLTTDRSAGLGALFAIVSTAAVVYHPQYVAHVIVVCLAICAVQFLAPRIPVLSRCGVPRRIGEHDRLYGQTLLLIGVFLLWSANHGFFSGFAGQAILSAVRYVLTGAGQAGESIGNQGGSLAAIGVSMTEIFLKLFFAHLVVAALAGILVVAALLFGRPMRFRDVPAVTTYFAAGLFGLLVLFGVYFLSVTNEMYFRVFGLMMVFGVVLASIAIHESVRSIPLPPLLVRTATVGAVAVLLVFALAAVFASPYVYSQSHHVPESQMTGYETAFENADGAEFVGFRGGPNRYADALHGGETRTKTHSSVSSETFDRPLADQYDADRYLVVSRVDYERETIAYRGIRYSGAEFASIERQRQVDRVQSNGEFELYRVTASEESG